MPVDKDFWIYWIIRCLTAPFGWMPLSWLRKIASPLGVLGFYCMRDFRKRTLSNLALATDLRLSQKEILKIAKQSFQNLAINCLEYPKLARAKNLAQMLLCKNPEVASSLASQGKGIIFFCGHQANWEVLFLDGTSRMKGIAIGKPIKNKHLYRWIVSIRERNGGKIIAPRNAVFEGLKVLKKGGFIGIVGDQGMPDSGYSFPFFGRRAWTSTAPALLSYKTGCPIIFASTRRIQTGYEIEYSDPIWPNLNNPIEEEVPKMMDAALTLMQQSIQKSPGEWLWQHNRWKQQTPRILYKRFRHDCICIILPEKKESWDALIPHLSTLKQIYAANFLSLMVPIRYQNTPLIEADEVFYYHHIEETLRSDFRFKLIFNFTDYRAIDSHFLDLSAFEVLNIEKLQKIAGLKTEDSLSDVFLKSLCRPGANL